MTSTLITALFETVTIRTVTIPSCEMHAGLYRAPVKLRWKGSPVVLRQSVSSALDQTARQRKEQAINDLALHVAIRICAGGQKVVTIHEKEWKG